MEKSKRGCPSKALTEKDERLLIRIAKNSPQLTSNELAKEFKTSKGNQVAASTIRKYLCKNGYYAYVARKKPLLSQKMIKND